MHAVAKVNAVLLLVIFCMQALVKADARLLLVDILTAGGGEGGYSVTISEYIACGWW
jgi:hypothetical protein